MTIKNYYFYIKPLLKKIKKGEYQYLNKDIIENDENILLFKKNIMKKNEDNPFFSGYYNFLLFAVANFCIKNNLNNTLEDLINILEIDIYITRNFNYLLTLSMIHKNYYFIKKNMKKIEYSQIKNSVEFYNIEFIKIINNEILKKHKNEILYNISSLENLSENNKEVFIFLIENYGYNKYYSDNAILNSLCCNGHLNLIKYLHKNKLIDVDIDFNDFLYSVIKNNHEDIFIFFLENYNINVHYKYNTLFYRIFLFDRVNFLQILHNYSMLNENNFKNEFREFIIFGAWDCFNYLLENNYIRNEYFFFNLIDIFKNINKFVNTKYKWGSKNFAGVDCSGLIQLFFNFNNKFCPRDAKDQIRYFKKKIELENIRKNDLIFWKGHVAVVISKNSLIHAYGPFKKTVKMPINKTIDRIYKTANLKVMGIRRIS